jgi:hypothetical protein
MSKYVKAAKEINEVVPLDGDGIDEKAKEQDLINQIKEVAEYVIDPKEDTLSNDTIAVLEELGVSPYPPLEKQKAVLEKNAEAPPPEPEPAKPAEPEKKEQEPCKEQPETKPEQTREDETLQKGKRGKYDSGVLEKATRLIFECAERGDMKNTEALQYLIDNGIKRNTAKTLLWTSKTSKHNRIGRLLTIDEDGFLVFKD